MDENKKNKSIQSRREFFKSAANTALPILGIVLFASNPIIAKAGDCMDCNFSCSGMCRDSCSGRCEGTCTTACARSCSTYCNGGCDIRCYKSAY